jgi:DNA-binding XRE family transcriptional regulator
MNPSVSFNTMLTASGLSQQEAASYLNVSMNSIDSWKRGRYKAPIGILRAMGDLVEAQENAANQTITQIKLAYKQYGELPIIDIGYPVDNYEAQTLGFPCVSAWLAMAGRVVAWCATHEPPIEVKLVPRGSTPETAAAIEAREKRLK